MIIGTICANKTHEMIVKNNMKLNLKNIALALGIAAGAAVTAVITTKNVNLLSDKTSSKNDDKITDDNKAKDEQDEDILYV